MKKMPMHDPEMEGMHSEMSKKSEKGAAAIWQTKPTDSIHSKDPAKDRSRVVKGQKGFKGAKTVDDLIRTKDKPVRVKADAFYKGGR